MALFKICLSSDWQENSQILRENHPWKHLVISTLVIGYVGSSPGLTKVDLGAAMVNIHLSASKQLTRESVKRLTFNWEHMMPQHLN